MIRVIYSKIQNLKKVNWDEKDLKELIKKFTKNDIEDEEIALIMDLATFNIIGSSIDIGIKIVVTRKNNKCKDAIKFDNLSRAINWAIYGNIYEFRSATEKIIQLEDKIITSVFVLCNQIFEIDEKQLCKNIGIFENDIRDFDEDVKFFGEEINDLLLEGNGFLRSYHFM